VLIGKYKDGTIKNIIDFRSLAKIARAERVSADRQTASFVLRKVFQKNDYSVEQAYNESVSDAYSERELLTRIDGLTSRLEEVTSGAVDQALRSALLRLQKQLSALLR
jgi:hypothetical protein